MRVRHCARRYTAGPAGGELPRVAQPPEMRRRASPARCGQEAFEGGHVALDLGLGRSGQDRKVLPTTPQQKKKEKEKEGKLELES